MKKNTILKEVKQFQKIAGLLNENEETISEVQLKKVSGSLIKRIEKWVKLYMMGKIGVKKTADRSYTVYVDPSTEYANEIKMLNKNGNGTVNIKLKKEGVELDPVSFNGFGIAMYALERCQINHDQIRFGSSATLYDSKTAFEGGKIENEFGNDISDMIVAKIGPSQEWWIGPGYSLSR